MTRGILSTLYAKYNQQLSTEDLLEQYKIFYKDEPFIEILESGQFANTQHVKHSNVCHIGAQVDARTKRIIVTSARVCTARNAYC